MSAPRSWHRALRLAVLALWIGSPGMALAHADIVERVAALDRAVENGPPSDTLYLKRGELHRLHHDWTAALADYQRAARLEPDNPAVHYYLGRMSLEAGRPKPARAALDRFLAVRPHHANALLVRSRALAMLGERLAAVSDLTRVIGLLGSPTPEVYLERARLLVSEGADHVDRALAGVDEGIARLGPLVTLVRFAIEVERTHGRHRSALARLDGLPRRLAGQPAWLGLRGDLLLAAGKRQEAHAAYAAALEIIETYPSARRRMRANLRLEARLRTSVEGTKAKP